MEENTETSKARSRGRTITNKQAMGLLEDSRNYFLDTAGNRNYVGDRHVTEILAESMARNGFIDLAGATTAVHERMKQFHLGEYQKAIDALWNDDAISGLEIQAKSTPYLAAVSELGQRLASFRGLYHRGKINWESSEPNILEAKRLHFPQDLSMIERLNFHQRGQRSPNR